MKEAIGTVVCKPVAVGGLTIRQPVVQLDDGSWFWITLPPDARYWPADPGQQVRIRYVDGEQFCEVVEEAADVVPMRR